MGGAAVVFLGVPEDEVAGQAFTHHQFLHDYDRPLGDGNNMFVSVSAPGDTESAPAGHRTVMISTHCELETVAGPCARGVPEAARVRSATCLITLARRVYPELGRRRRRLRSCHTQDLRAVHRPAAGCRGRSAADPRAIRTSTRSPTIWASPATGWSATAHGRVWEPSHAASAAASSPRA